MKYGCILSPTDLRDFKFKRMNVYAADLPDMYEVGMAHKIKSQGQVCSCVAHALSSILEYFDGNKVKLSTNFIYGIHHRLYGTNGPGMMLRSACKLVQKYGDMTHADCPGNTEIEEVYDIASSAFDDKDKLNKAYKYKLVSYVNVNSERDIKYAILNHGPVIASVKWYDNYVFNPNTKFIVSDKTGDYGYHAIIIYGWDSSGWFCQNSWGTKWGDKGLFKLHFDDGPREAYSLVDDKTIGSDDDIVDPTYKVDLIEVILKFINKIIAKLFTRN